MGKEGLPVKIYDYHGKKNLCGDRIHQARTTQRMSQSGWAARMQVNGVVIEREAISKIETGDRFVTDYELLVFAKVLGVSVDWLLVDRECRQIAYFKLGDLAALVNQTDKQFSVSWNEQKQYIHINTNRPYTLVGGELSGSTVTQQAKPSTHNIYMDGRPFHFTAYEIAWNNYFKLRGLATALDIGIGWDEAAQRVDILTTQGYDKPSREEMLPISRVMHRDRKRSLWSRSDKTPIRRFVRLLPVCPSTRPTRICLTRAIKRNFIRILMR